MAKQTFITQEGFEKLSSELQELKTAKRKEIAARIQEAKELGDLSENAEYSEAKNEQAFVEGRIQELSGMLKEAVIIESTHGESQVVEVGSTFTAKGPHGTETFTIVGSNEANPPQGLISNESPVGAAFLGKRVGAKVAITAPRATLEYELLAIR